MGREARAIQLTAGELPTIGAVFRHFRGDYYKIADFAWNANVNENDPDSQLVLYRPFGNIRRTSALWSRPMREFSQEVRDDNGQWIRRFRKVPTD